MKKVLMGFFPSWHKCQLEDLQFTVKGCCLAQISWKCTQGGVDFSYKAGELLVTFSEWD